MSAVQFRTAVAKAHAEKTTTTASTLTPGRHTPLKDALAKRMCGRAIVGIMVQRTETSSRRINKERGVTALHCRHTDTPWPSSSKGFRHPTYDLTRSLPQPRHSPSWEVCTEAGKWSVFRADTSLYFNCAVGCAAFLVLKAKGYQTSHSMPFMYARHWRGQHKVVSVEVLTETKLKGHGKEGIVM